MVYRKEIKIKELSPEVKQETLQEISKAFERIEKTILLIKNNARCSAKE